MRKQDYPKDISPETLWKAIESTRSAFIITDCSKPDDPVIYANQAFCDLTGYSQDEIIGRNCRFLQGRDTSERTIARIRDAVKAGEHIQVRIRNYRKDGTPFWNDLIMSPVRDAGGKLTHFVGCQLDVTDRVSFEERLQKATRRLAQSNRELEQFTYAASHDLQEPLRMVSSYLQLIRERYEHKLDEDGDIFIGYAVEGAHRMQELVNDLLMLSRVRTAARELRYEDMDKILEVVLANMQITISESHAVVTHDALPRIEVDRTQMTQLLQNLISNALKYRSPDKEPVVHIGVQKGRGNYTFSVSDNGIGIEPVYFERIFGMFQRLHTRSEFPGTGVGLAICSKIVERHGGRIWVESVPGEGSVFYFSLPVKQKGDRNADQGDDGTDRYPVGRG